MNKPAKLRSRNPGTADGQMMYSLVRAAHVLESRLEEALEQVGLSLANLAPSRTWLRRAAFELERMRYEDDLRPLEHDGSSWTVSRRTGWCAAWKIPRIAAQ